MKRSNYKYKDSGIEWLGEIPFNWSLKRLKYLTSCNSDTLPESTDPDEEIRYIDISSVVYPQGIQNVEKIVFSAAPSRARRLVKKGDTIVSTVRTYLKAIAPIEGDDDSLVVSTGFAVIRPRYLVPKYLSRILMSHYCVEAIASISIGVSYPAVNASDIGNIVTPEPPIEEQQAIASFLDRETARIDALIQKKERMIELLKEKSPAFITQAVTKGLDPNVPMKDSGIEWLGKVPEHWEIFKLKNASYVIMGQSPGSDDYSDDSDLLPFLQGNSDFTTRFPIPRVYCDKANKIASKGSILVSVRAPVGALNEADQDYGIGRGLCAINPKSNLHKEFAWYQLHVTRLELISLATGSTYDAVSVDEVAGMTFLVPQLEEQQAIADFLDRETARIDTLISKINDSITLLREYRSSLIHHAVTGKIDLRECTNEHIS